jgi:hypothetical protein
VTARRCKPSKTHFPTSDEAERRLDRIYKTAPRDQLYLPTGWTRCGCGRFVLTSDTAIKPIRRGHGRTHTRRR